jgi:type VI secretion system secreted protein VgrG
VATVRPWLWFLTRRADCRIFQDLTVPEILTQVFEGHETADFALELTQEYRTRGYCVQYRETDFNFVSRLMEDEGLYYYFRQTDGHHTMVLTDSTSKHEAAPGYEELPFIAPDRLVRPEIEHISRWVFGREVQPGAYVHDDYDLERPSVELRVQRTAVRPGRPAALEIYDYPGLYQQRSDGETTADIRLEEYGAQFETAEADTNARGVQVGALFTLAGCPREDQNAEHLVVGATWDLEYAEYEAMPGGGGASYACRFSTLSTRQQFRTARTTRRPFVQGPQTAVVVGPAGEELFTDEYGRVKVQFHWDREGARDENSSCWIRVSQPWAGKGWGSVATPRIGQEVIVDFLEGDPDQPIITGRVYNAELQPPFGFPAGAVISGLKSATHKGAGYNEISADDTAGAEKITIHAQYDMNTTVLHDQTTTVHNNRTDQIDVDDAESVGVNQTLSVGSNQRISIGADRDESVGGNESIAIGGQRTELVGGAESVTIGGGRTHTVSGVQSTTVSLAETHTVGAGRMHNVGAAEAITVGGAQVVSIGAAHALTVGGAQMTKVGAVQSVTVGGAHRLSAANISQSASAQVAIKAGSKAVVEAPTIVLKAGGSQIIMNSSGITIKASKVTVKASGTLTLKGDGGVKVKGATVGEN